ncbi:MAG: OmpA family protein, partial [Pseudomonadota bacterium]
VVLGWASSAAALDLPPGAVALLDTREDLVVVDVPAGPVVADRQTTLTVEGEWHQRTWRAPLTGDLTRLFADVRDSLELGRRQEFQCAAKACGGFEFRFLVPVVPPPNMEVDLGEYYYARFTSETEVHVGLLVSRRFETAYVQITQISLPGASVEPEPPAVEPTTSENEIVTLAPAPPASNLPLAEVLKTQGFAVLETVQFATGSFELGEGAQPAMADLAELLVSQPGLVLDIVGHSDTQGALDSNRALSQRRAEAVRATLLEQGVPASQVAATGIGSLSPRDTNATPEGRARNRRVEIVVRVWE